MNTVRVGWQNTDKKSGGPVGCSLISLRFTSEGHTSIIPKLVLAKAVGRSLKELIVMQWTLDRKTLMGKMSKRTKHVQMSSASTCQNSKL